MTFDEYQKAALRTAKRAQGEEHCFAMHLAIMALGLAGEAGEVADLIKKKLGHGKLVTHNEVIKELGDVLWYIAAVADCYGVSMDEIAAANVAKLLARYPNGFTHADSNNRRETAGLADRGNGSGGEAE